MLILQLVIKKYFILGAELIMKEKLLLVLSDIDDTFRPVDWNKPVDRKSIEEFYKFSNELKNEGIKTKLCFISARPAIRVREQMEIVNSIVNENLSEISVGEQGSVFLNLKTQKPIVDDINLEIEKINKYVMEKYSDLFFRSEGSITTTYFELRKNSDNMSPEFRNRAAELEKDIKLNFKLNNLNIRIIHNINGVEITDTRFDKDDGIKYLIDKYQRKYDIVGLTYSGDAVNDIKAIKYMSKLAEVPGVRVNVLIPNNAVESINSSLESWKNNINGTTKVIRKSSKNYFEGIIDLIKGVHKEGNLIGRGAYIQKDIGNRVVNSMQNSSYAVSNLDKSHDMQNQLLKFNI